MSKWEKIELHKCDLCDRVAKFSHPKGGLRCDKCPKPDDQAAWCKDCL